MNERERQTYATGRSRRFFGPGIRSRSSLRWPCRPLHFSWSRRRIRVRHPCPCSWECTPPKHLRTANSARLAPPSSSLRFGAIIYGNRETTKQKGRIVPVMGNSEDLPKRILPTYTFLAPSGSFLSSCFDTCSLGTDLVTRICRPPKVDPFKASTAASTSSGALMSTKAKPRGWPVSRFRGTLTSSTFPCAVNKSLTCESVASAIV